ncbi:hypothetical protein [Vibrio algicola]|uniref:Uncharacterized protein n=1 Tax=Vibrio algicola TaxID=2662262 RepID=A0A5Q0THV4_9VIBR|nr:hypothetical protein [Vibrio algicola]
MSFYKLNPDLKNARAFERFKDGRKARFNDELNDLQNGIEPRLHKAPLYSHNSTWQSQFRRGFESVTANDLAQFRYRYAENQKQQELKTPLHPRIQSILRNQNERNAHANH